MIKTKYVMKKIVIDSSSISDFYMDYDTRRQIRNGQVNQLKKHLLNGGHFSSPLVVNETNLGLKVIDGNHRTEAIKSLISEDATFSIEVWVAVYKDLSPEQEREVYREWNSGVKQSATDFLKSHWESIPLRRAILSRLPVSIYGSKTTMPVKAFVGNQIQAKKEKENFEGGYSGGIFQVVEDFRSLEDTDIDLLSDFYDFISSVIGSYQNKGDFYTTTSMGALYRIWYDNKDNMDTEKMKKVFLKVLDRTDRFLLDNSKAGGRSATTNFYDEILTKLNRKSRIKFLSDKEVYKIRLKAKKEQEKMNKIGKLVY